MAAIIMLLPPTVFFDAALNSPDRLALRGGMTYSRNLTPA